MHVVMCSLESSIMEIWQYWTEVCDESVFLHGFIWQSWRLDFGFPSNLPASASATWSGLEGSWAVSLILFEIHNR